MPSAEPANVFHQLNDENSGAGGPDAHGWAQAKSTAVTIPPRLAINTMGVLSLINECRFILYLSSFPGLDLWY
jgi:hypothetical protein